MIKYNKIVFGNILDVEFADMLIKFEGHVWTYLLVKGQFKGRKIV